MARSYLILIYISEILCFISLQSHLLEGSLLLSLNCGGPAFKDPTTKIEWASDDGFVVNGANGNVSESSAVTDPIFQTLRFFSASSGKNNKFCYTLTNLGSGNLYLIRVGFFYGNYDGLNRPPSFALLLNYDVWIQQVNTSSDKPLSYEIIFLSPNNVAYVCLAPDGSSIGSDPFISYLQISLLNDTMYNRTNEMGGLGNGYALHLKRRINYGATSNVSIRYPNDSFDRIWEANTTEPREGLEANVVMADSESTGNTNLPPKEVMETAIEGRSVDAAMEIQVDGEIIGEPGVYVALHFADLSNVREREGLSRGIVVEAVAGEDIDDFPFWTSKGFPQILEIDQRLGLNPSPFTITIAPINNASLLSTGPAFVNALELLTWSPSPLITHSTSPSDVSALENIQQMLNLTLLGDGDPCLPENYGWSWVTCNNNNENLRVIEINLTNFNIQGSIEDISPFINTLTELQKLYFADNELDGSIPDFSALQKLQVLDLRNNQLTGPIPSSLSQLPQLKQVLLDGNSNLCGGSTISLLQQKNVSITYKMSSTLCETCVCPSTPTNSSGLSLKTKYIIAISAIATFNLASIVGILLFCKLQRRKIYEQIKSNVYKALVKDTNEIFPIQYLTYEEIKEATNQFSNKIGEGGFGDVFRGTLQNGQDVAIKLLADASRQGLKEFNSEVAVLSSVHHRNLVSLIGYSTEKAYTLVYEYIPRGNLRDNLYGEDFEGNPLSWESRLSIAIDTALGLEYLHMGCEPSIIHRDVKSSNILLTEDLHAKVADFGLSRLRGVDNTKSHVSTLNVVGTIGYLDPEYSNTNQFTEKSDVYSFGVVLFELICGRPPIDSFSVPPHIISWVMPSIVDDRIENIVDPKLIGGYKMESIKVVVDVALKCVSLDRNLRPNMSEVIQGLREAQKIDNGLKFSQQDITSNSDLLEVKVQFKDVSINSNASDQGDIIELESRSINLAR